MSDPKRATLITVGAPKSAKNNVNKTVRLTINLVESNESKYPELNYKELVIAEEKRKRVANGKTPGLDPFSDNDDDVERVARKFEQKYGGNSTYGRKGRSKHDDFADIGAGYDENDSFIDNTHGYDEMIPPECDTLYGGFYINCGSLEFKTVSENQPVMSDGDPANRRNKRRISSSSSEDESSESSSESSQDEKDPKAVVNGAVDSHETVHRKKKKNKKIEKKKANKIRRTDSQSAATSGKQTSDDNGHGEAESADSRSRTSQSDSLTSKPAPSSENPITSDSSRDIETKVEVQLPPSIVQVVEELEAVVQRLRVDNPNTLETELFTKTEQHLMRVDRALSKSNEKAVIRATWTRVARVLRMSRAKLLQRIRTCAEAASHVQEPQANLTTTIAQTTTATTTITTAATTKHKLDDDVINVKAMTPDEVEAKIVETLQKLKALIEDRKPGMMANYNAECERVQEERKKIQIASAAEGAPHIEKRLPKRRFPWCPTSRALLARLKRLAGDDKAAGELLALRALPLFPSGFVRMPTLLRQADLNKELKVSDVKRPRLGSITQQPPQLPPPVQFSEPIQFPSSLTVTTTMKTSPDKPEVSDDKDSYRNSVYGSIINSFSLSKDLIMEKPEERKESVIVEKAKEDLYIPPNNIGSITITPVLNNQQKEKTISAITLTEKPKEGLIRIKSPAALNEMISKKEKEKSEKKKTEKSHINIKEKRVDTPLHIDTSYPHNKKDPSPKNKDETQKDQKSQKHELKSQKQIESMRIAENNIPRPALIPVHHSPTFAKPDKRPPETKKKKDVLIISDVDPLGDVQIEPVAIDDSSSDVEVVEERSDKSEPKSSDKSDTVPSKDKVSSRDAKKVNNNVKPHKHKDRISSKDKHEHKNDIDEATKEEISNLMRNISEMEHSQEQSKLNSHSFGGIINNARHEKSATSFHRNAYGEPHNDNKFAERTSLNKMDGCSAIRTG